jgi:putative RecB family exonuclease
MPETVITSPTITPDTEMDAEVESPVRRLALSPSRASDFKQCPLLYRFRVIDRLPEKSSKAQVRGTLVHAVLEKLFALPRGDRDPKRAKELIEPAWDELSTERPEWTELFQDENPEQVQEWLSSAAELVETYFTLEDPRRFEPEACELRVETELDSGVRLRGFVDRIDVAPTGEIRVVDYKTGASPKEFGELKALFQMKFYAVVLHRLRGVVPRQLKLMYLSNGQSLTYEPDLGELERFERTLEALWKAIEQTGKAGDFQPKPSKLCQWCDHQSHCPEFGNTPPEYPGWPEDASPR